MTALRFEITGARAEPYAAVPTLILRLRITEVTGTPVHAVVLRGQIRIEPQRRRYGADEEQRLAQVFGATPRWGDTLRPFLWTHVSTTATGFRDSTEIDLPVVCTYDFEVAATSYLQALDDGEIPLVVLFSGTTFAKGDPGLSIEPVAWDAEAPFRLPVQLWRDTMDCYFPNSRWLRLDRPIFDALQRFKVAYALPSFDQAVERLLKEAGGEA